MFYSQVADVNEKRKMKEDADETAQEIPHTPATANQVNLFNAHQPQPQPHPQAMGQTIGTSLIAPPKSNPSYVQQVLNAALPFKRPFSFMSLLTAPECDDDFLPHKLHPDVKFQTEIDQTILFHNENLKRSLMGMMWKQQREIEERTIKKLKEKEIEMNKRATELEEKYTKENKKLKEKLRKLEMKAESKRATSSSLEDSESSSSVRPEHVDLVRRLECKACGTEVATVMMWPCRHVCVCKSCEKGTKTCPVCRNIVTTSVAIILPSN